MMLSEMCYENLDILHYTKKQMMIMTVIAC